MLQKIDYPPLGICYQPLFTSWYYISVYTLSNTIHSYQESVNLQQQTFTADYNLSSFLYLNLL